MNDGAMLRRFGSPIEYMTASLSRANAGHVSLLGCHTATVATRPIKAGEEVLVTYGAKYWQSKHRRQVERISQAVSSFL